MRRVVIVEDQLILREFIKKLIEEDPMLKLVGETGDGLEGYKLASSHKPDLLILDIMLPGLNGVGILRKLKQELPDIQVLGFSAFPNRSLVKQMLEAGAKGLVQKTESLQVLETAIKMVSQGQSYYSPHVSEIMRDLMLSPDQVNSIEELTNREREILQLVAESNSNKEIAEKLSISVKTAETHRNRIISKLNIHDAAGLTRYAIANGLVDPASNNF